MSILRAIKREEKKLETQLQKLQHELNGREVTTVRKRVMSAAARAKIGRAAKKRWAKFRAEAKKLAK
jgi:hypothetical protein